jgi:hypothetical protein
MREGGGPNKKIDDYLLSSVKRTNESLRRLQPWNCAAACFRHSPKTCLELAWAAHLFRASSEMRIGASITSCLSTFPVTLCPQVFLESPLAQRTQLGTWLAVNGSHGRTQLRPRPAPMGRSISCPNRVRLPDGKFGCRRLLCMSIGQDAGWWAESCWMCTAPPSASQWPTSCGLTAPAVTASCTDSMR